MAKAVLYGDDGERLAAIKAKLRAVASRKTTEESQPVPGDGGDDD